MAIDFPNSPTVNDTYTAGGKTWQWTGTYWSAYGTNPILRASDTAPLSPNANDLWYETDTGSLFAYVDGYWVELGASSPVTASAGDLIGTTLASNVVSSSLTSVGTIANLQATAATINGWTVSQPGLVLVKTQAVGSGVSSVTVTDAFSSTYDNYFVTVTGGVGSAIAIMRVQLGATATGYYQSGYNVTYAGVGSIVTTNNGTTFANTGVVTTDSIIMSFHLWGPNLAKRTYIESTYIYGAIAGGGDSMTVGGYVNNTTQYTAFTISPASGTLTGGTIRVYGYRNS